MKTSVEKNYQKDIARIGNIRARVHDSNIKTKKKHDLPERLLEKEWKAVEVEKQKAQETLKQSLKTLFENEISLFLKRLETEFGIKKLKATHENATKQEDYRLVVQTLLDWRRLFELTRRTSKGGVIVIVDKGYNNGILRIGQDVDDFTLPSETIDDLDPVTTSVAQEGIQVKNIIRQIINQAAGTQRTFQRIATREIQEGLERGLDFSQIVRRVGDKAEEQIGYRLDRIVQTAGNGGFEAGQVQGFIDSGIERGSWLTQRDPRVRSPSVGDLWDHRGADGQVQELEDGWVISGRGLRQETLRFPGDPQGSPGNIIYCRCTITPKR